MKHERLINKLRNAGLTEREADISVMVTMGLSNAEVANQLFVTELTVKHHLNGIYVKLQLKGRVQLIVLCLPFADGGEKYADVIARHK